MGNEYMQYPGTVKALAAEIRGVCDDYYAKKINNDKVKEVILWYAANQTEKLFVGETINPTIAKILGKRRVQLVNVLLAENGGR